MDLVIAHVSKDYGRGPVLRDVSLTVRQGETVCLMGPSGLGKTTLLRCVAGLETPDAGAVTGVPRRLGYVFQEDRLCDSFSAVANIRLVTGRTLWPSPGRCAAGRSFCCWTRPSRDWMSSAAGTPQPISAATRQGPPSCV